MPKTRLTNAKREQILKDVMKRLDLGDVQSTALTAFQLAHKTVSAAVERACPSKDLKVLSKYQCTRSSTSPILRTEKGMRRDTSFNDSETNSLQGDSKHVPAFKGPDKWKFFEYEIIVTDEEMDTWEEWKLAKSAWTKARSTARADFKAVLYGAKTVEDLEEVLPLDKAYFANYKKPNQALTVSGDVVARVKSAKLDPTS